MNPEDFALLRQQLKRDEGLRLFPYVDTVGKITIGYGRNLSDNGITQLEASDMLDQDISRHIADLQRGFPFVLDLDGVRQVVLGNMVFNLGLTRLAEFRQMWNALRRRDYEKAAESMMQSKWAEQVGARATRLAEAMRSGEFK